jgi:hypothetical protein
MLKTNWYMPKLLEKINEKTYEPSDTACQNIDNYYQMGETKICI